jgi:hypothetical protein
LNVWDWQQLSGYTAGSVCGAWSRLPWLGD